MIFLKIMKINQFSSNEKKLALEQFFRLINAKFFYKFFDKPKK